MGGRCQEGDPRRGSRSCPPETWSPPPPTGSVWAARAHGRDRIPWTAGRSLGLKPGAGISPGPCGEWAQRGVDYSPIAALPLETTHPSQAARAPEGQTPRGGPGWGQELLGQRPRAHAVVLASALQPPTHCALPQGRPGMNGLKGEKGEPGDASVGFGMRVSVQWGVRGGAGATKPGGLVSGIGSQSSTLGGFCVALMCDHRRAEPRAHTHMHTHT